MSTNDNNNGIVNNNKRTHDEAFPPTEVLGIAKSRPRRQIRAPVRFVDEIARYDAMEEQEKNDDDYSDVESDDYSDEIMDDRHVDYADVVAIEGDEKDKSFVVHDDDEIEQTAPSEDDDDDSEYATTTATSDSDNTSSSFSIHSDSDNNDKSDNDNNDDDDKDKLTTTQLNSSPSFDPVPHPLQTTATAAPFVVCNEETQMTLPELTIGAVVEQPVTLLSLSPSLTLTPELTEFASNLADP